MTGPSSTSDGSTAPGEHGTATAVDIAGRSDAARSRRAGPLALLVALVAFGLSIWAPGPPIHGTDDFLWLWRSGNFRHAIAHHNFADASVQGAGPEFAHNTMPGVTTMWAGAIGLALSERQLPATQPDARSARAFTIARGLIAFACAAALWLLIVFVAELAGRSTALVTGALLATEPWLAGHSHMLHTDAMVTMFSAAALAAGAAAAQRALAPRPAPVGWMHKAEVAGAISGVLCGLALLTKVSALALIGPAAASLTLLTGIAASHTTGLRPWARRWVGSGAAAVGTCTVTVLALWPALLVAPSAQFRALRASMQLAGESTFGFARGALRTQPGRGYYAVVLGYRLSPWLLCLSVLALVAAVIGLALRAVRRTPRMLRAPWWFTATLSVVAALYGVTIVFAAKWYDRYALPLFPFLALAAGLFVAQAWQWVTRNRRAWHRAGPPLLCALTLCAATVVVRQAPDAVSYVDPLLGGQERASHDIRLGWGEGIERANAIIRHDAGTCADVHVAVRLAYAISLTCGTAVPDPSSSASVDYIVEYIATRQVEGPATIPRRYGRQARVIGEVRVQGFPYVWVWRVRHR